MEQRNMVMYEQWNSRVSPKPPSNPGTAWRIHWELHAESLSCHVSVRHNIAALLASDRRLSNEAHPCYSQMTGHFPKARRGSVVRFSLRPQIHQDSTWRRRLLRLRLQRFGRPWNKGIGLKLKFKSRLVTVDLMSRSDWWSYVIIVWSFCTDKVHINMMKVTI